eukprot:1739092-Prymnesium_polylepis.2
MPRASISLVAARAGTTIEDADARRPCPLTPKAESVRRHVTGEATRDASAETAGWNEGALRD